MTKRFIISGLIGVLLIAPGQLLAQGSKIAILGTQGTLTVTSFQWDPKIDSKGAKKFLKATVAFHYEGQTITLGADYLFSVTCNIATQSPGGTKFQYYEISDLSILTDPEVDGPKDISVPLTFTFNPSEYSAATKKGVICSTSYSPDNEMLKTVFAAGVKTITKMKPVAKKWKAVAL